MSIHDHYKSLVAIVDIMCYIFGIENYAPFIASFCHVLDTTCVYCVPRVQFNRMIHQVPADSGLLLMQLAMNSH